MRACVRDAVCARKKSETSKVMTSENDFSEIMGFIRLFGTYLKTVLTKRNGSLVHKTAEIWIASHVT